MSVAFNTRGDKRGGERSDRRLVDVVLHEERLLVGRLRARDVLALGGLAVGLGPREELLLRRSTLPASPFQVLMQDDWSAREYEKVRRVCVLRGTLLISLGRWRRPPRRCRPRGRSRRAWHRARSARACGP